MLPAILDSRRLLSVVALLSLSLASVAAADPSYGLFYERHEPTFYAGYAPRALDPKTVHLHIGRGNQLRVTVVLTDQLLDSYARDLLARYRTIHSLMDSGEVQLTQNTAFDALETTQRGLALDALVAADAGLAPEALRERNLALMERLNPGRVFRIRMPLEDVIVRWMAGVSPRDLERMDADRQLDLLDAMLPSRLYFDRSGLDPETSAQLKALVADALRTGGTPRPFAAATIRPAFLKLFQRITDGRYPVRGDALEFAEFTALYPVGSVNEYTEYKGRQIPLYPTPGRRQITTHQRSGTPDHIAPWASYSYSPWLPYMHVGSNMHNAFHTPYWPLELAKADWLPEALKKTGAKSRDGSGFTSLYLLSRGPISHGCTHVNPGHLVELRQILPADTGRLDQVEVFINQSHLYDVFDIDGDGEPEVMGVRYFVAYSLRDTHPDRLRAPVERTPFYDWLYGGELRQEPDGTGYFTDIHDAKFDGDRATEGSGYARIRLYEAAYEPERVQFYATRPIPFVRELRKVGADHPFSEARARSDQAL